MSVPENPEQAVVEGLSPVRRLPTDPTGDAPEPGVALCLSGGGYRAMVFHVGALWRLNELGWLREARPRLQRLGRIDHGRRPRSPLVRARLRRGRHRPGIRAGDRRADPQPGRQDDRHLRRPEGDLPAWLGRELRRPALRRRALQRRDPPGHPRPAALRLQRDEPPVGRALAVLEAVHVGLPGRRGSPTRRSKLAIAVAASSAFPPFLSPMRLTLSPADYEPGTRHRPPAGGVPARPVLSRRRGLRQPRARDGLEAVHDASSSATAAGTSRRRSASGRTGCARRTACSA